MEDINKKDPKNIIWDYELLGSLIATCRDISDIRTDSIKKRIDNFIDSVNAFSNISNVRGHNINFLEITDMEDKIPLSDVSMDNLIFVKGGANNDVVGFVSCVYEDNDGKNIKKYVIVGSCVSNISNPYNTIKELVRGESKSHEYRFFIKKHK